MIMENKPKTKKTNRKNEAARRTEWPADHSAGAGADERKKAPEAPGRSISLEERVAASVRSALESGKCRREPRERLAYTVSEEDRDASVRQILKRRLGFSGRLLAKLKRGEGRVFRNGVEVRLFADVMPGDLVEVELPEDRSHFEPQDIPVKVLYEDEDLLIVDKQPGLVVHPTRTHPDDTLANGLMKYMMDRNDSFKIRFVNRIDRDTSGLVMVAKNSHCQDAMSEKMKKKAVEKRYLAIVHGIFTEEEGTVDLPLGRPDDDDVRRAVVPDGYPSVTHYTVRERFPAGFTLLELRLETGRTHQIRVHMSHIGHPIAGDSLYGKEEPEIIGRQALHAYLLRFTHPVTGDKIEVEAPMPEDMKDLTERLRRR